MITIKPADLSSNDVYRLLISVVVPRPIGWASTMGANGIPNLAPFSFFNAVGANPPTIMLSVEQRAGQAKDTLRNIQETGEFVINIVDHVLAEAMVQTSGEWPYEVDEFVMAGLEKAPSLEVKPPRVALAPVALEARLTQIVPVEGTDNIMILGRVVCFHLREGLLRPNGLVDATLLQPLARLGGNEYAFLGQVLSLRRPKV
jgi:flavin reductase (DIM6/NTAB) family NADH-FMN oxidoreductase RutF